MRGGAGRRECPQKLSVSEKLGCCVGAGVEILQWFGFSKEGFFRQSLCDSSASVPTVVLEPCHLIKMPKLTLCTYSKLGRYINVTGQFCPPVSLSYLRNKTSSLKMAEFTLHCAAGGLFTRLFESTVRIPLIPPAPPGKVFFTY